jgi:hypothetical protein
VVDRCRLLCDKRNEMYASGLEIGQASVVRINECPYCNQRMWYLNALVYFDDGEETVCHDGDPQRYLYLRICCRELVESETSRR